MKKIETSLSTLKSDIGNFYKADKHQFMVMNIVDLGAQLEVQWFFADYAHPCDVTCFFTLIEPSVQIPSIAAIVGGAWVAEAELVDLMGVEIENAKKGFVLEDDFEGGSPLRKKK
jgi:NADH:ubiquinone oxidoreductase subunit C